MLRTLHPPVEERCDFAWSICVPDLPGTPPYETGQNPIIGRTYYSPSPLRMCVGHGILTMCPSGAAFAIPLGPTNPGLIVMARETLVFRCAGFSPALWLLVPAFSLLYAPRWVTPFSSSRNRTLSYRLHTSQERRT